MISTFQNFSPLRNSISPRNQIQIQWFLIPWNRFKVYFLKISISPISTINFLSDLIKFEDYVKKLLNSLWIRPLFTIIPLNSWLILKIGKFGIIFDAIPREIDDLEVSSRHVSCKGESYMYMYLCNIIIQLSNNGKRSYLGISVFVRVVPSQLNFKEVVICNL